MGTGIPDMIKACLDAGLPEPEPIQEESFKMLLWRKGLVTDQATDQVQRPILVMNKEMPRQDIMKLLELKHNQTFRENYLYPALEGNWIEMTIPEKSNDPNQK